MLNVKSSYGMALGGDDTYVFQIFFVNVKLCSFYKAK